MTRHTDSDWMSRLQEQSPGKPALVTANGTLTYGELATRSAAARTLFLQRGLRPGQHVMLAIRDERQFICLLLGAYTAGLTVMVADTDLPGEAATEMVQRYEPDVVVLDRSLAEHWHLPGPSWLIEAEPQAQQGALLRRLLRRSKVDTTGLFFELDAVVDTVMPTAVAGGDAVLIFFTSGSTSLPKAVELSHAALGAHLSTLARHHGYNADTRLLNPLPFHHVDGLVQGPLVALSVGASTYRALAFTALNVPHFLDQIYSEGITHLVAVPTILAMILRLGAHQTDSFKGPEFCHVISTAGHLEEPLWRRFEDQFDIVVCNTYGLTETVAGGIFSGPGADSRKVGALGLPVDCEVRIITANGQDAEQGATGELLLRGTNLMRGYYRDQQATDAVLRDGWLHTGDLAWSDEEGFIHFAGRAKSVIVCGGHNIQPEEINEILGRHAGVQAVATLGLPHPEWEAIVVSAIVPVATNTPTEAELLAHCRLFLPPYKLPRRIVFLAALPYGPSGKVRAEALRELCLTTSSAVSMTDTHTERIMSLAKDIFRTHPGELGPNSGPDNTMGWDSLAHIQLVTSIETQFSIVLNDHDIVGITHLGAVVDIVERALSRG
jgi:acyl-CoA synthetase (AMP-forming)/AMP-acid ligase II/acyl carrier protein